VLLGAIKQQASKRGTEFRYNFGDAKANPSITIPLFAVDRMIVSENPVELPVDTDSDKGTWRLQDGRLVPVDRATVSLQAGSCATFMMATSYLDFESWCVTNIPGVGNLDLTQFWGQQPLHAMVFDEEPSSSGYASADSTRRFFDLELQSIVGEASPLKAPSKDPFFDDKPMTANDADDEIKDREFELVDVAVEETDAGDDSPRFDDEPMERRLSHYTDDGKDHQDSSDENENVEDRKTGEADEWETQSQHNMSNKTVRLLAGVNAGRQFQPQELQGPNESDTAEDIKARLVSIPWYFCNGAGDLWWCIDYNGRACWRHHSHLQQLCYALGGALPDLGLESSLQNLEYARRMAARLLTQGSTAPGLLEEFTQMGVSLEGLLSGAMRPKSKAMFLGVVEAEGRIIERYVWANGQTLRWCVRRSRHRRAKVHDSIDLKLVTMSTTSVAGAGALKISSSQKGHLLVAKDQAHLTILEESLRSLQTNGVLGISVENTSSDNSETEKIATTPASRFSSIPSTVSRALAEAAASVPGAWLKGTMAAVQETAAKKLHRPRPAWKDLLRRWPANRIVVNNAELSLAEVPVNPVALSAELLKLAVAAQGNLSMVHDVTIRSCALKRVDLSGLRDQDIWAFWVNVYHSLLVHAQLVAGRPSNVQQIFGFYSGCSYLVAGHAFSLLEIEHSILRHNMTKPKIVLVGTILRSWPRSDEDLETRPCLAAPVCAAACFACRPDWRLNLVLNAGNIACADTIPVFESTDEVTFNSMVQKAMDQTLSSCGCIARDVIELPYNLSRYRDDAPMGSSRESSERRWVNVLFPDMAERVDKVVYKRGYGWTMRKQLKIMEVKVEKSRAPVLVEI
jgi:hypothetical protein